MRSLIIIAVILVLVVAAMCVRHTGVPDTFMRTSSDQIHLSGTNPAHSAAILVDGRRAGCIDDEVVRSASSAVVENLLSPNACGSRVAILVQDKAMHFDDSVGVWTDDGGDVLNVALSSMRQLPMSIWVPTGGSGDAKTHLAAAGLMYNEMQCGISIDSSVPIVEEPRLDPMSGGCDDLAPLKAIGYAQGALNVYYVQEITDRPDARGIHCNTDPTVILISALGVTATLAHELGHAFTLDHTNDVPGLDTYSEGPPGTFVCNLMLSGGVNQRLLSTGQCFRTNLNGASAINTLNAPALPTPGCDRTAGTPSCPPLAFDVVPK